MKKAYIAGKITGLPLKEAELNFKEKEQELKNRGFEVFNPLSEVKKLNLQRLSEGKRELTDQDNRKEIMRFCIQNMLSCDEVHLLPNWTNSRGAWDERVMAQKYGIGIVYPKLSEKWNY